MLLGVVALATFERSIDLVREGRSVPTSWYETQHYVSSPCELGRKDDGFQGRMPALLTLTSAAKNANFSQSFKLSRGSIIGIAWNPVTNAIATLASDGYIRVVNSRLQSTYVTSFPSNVNPTCISWMPDGKRLAVTSDGGEIRMLDPATKRTTWKRILGVGSIVGLSVSPSGKRVACCSFDDHTTYILSDLGKVVSIANNSTAAVSVAFSPSGDRLAISSAFGEVGVFSLKSKHYIRLRRADRNLDTFAKYPIAWSTDSKNILASNNGRGGITLLDPSSGKPKGSIEMDDLETISDIRILRRGNIVAAIDQSGSLAVSSIKSPHNLYHQDGSVTAIDLGPDNHSIASGNREGEVTISRWE